MNGDNPEVQRFVDSVANFWIEFAGIDGWRLDDASEVSQALWKQFRTSVKTTRPDALILGEIWGESHEFLQGDEHDSEMNYRWRDAVLHFFARSTTTPSGFDAELRAIREDYPDMVTPVMYNLVGSHDTERIKTLLHGDPDLLRAVALFQFTYPGVPAVYYGDEIGMEGGRDPDDRRCMIWDRSRWDTGLFDFYKALAALRSENAAIRRGSYRTILADDASDVFGFERRLGANRLRTYINRSAKEQRIRVRGRLSVSNGAELSGGWLTLAPLGCAVVMGS